MASQSDSGRAEQIISQFLLKSLHVILAARVPSLGGGPRHLPRATKRDRRFNLVLGDFPAALEHPGFWHHGVFGPMVVDILLSPIESADPEAVIERWTVQCESPPASPSLNPTHSSSLLRKTYKMSIVLLRAIYSILRLLPAHRVFRMLCASNQYYNYDLSYKVSSFAEPFSRAEERGFKLYTFTPVETQFGYLAVSVMYRHNLTRFALEVSSLTSMMIINDYVGSPAADPMRAFPSSPSDISLRPTSFPSRAGRSLNPPSFARPHSWTSVPLAHHPRSTSPLSDLGVSPPDVSGDRRTVSQAQPPAASRKGSYSFEEFRSSPLFPMSPSPSPPMHGGNPLHHRLRSNTLPVSIPQPVTGNSQLHHTPNLSDPTRSPFPPPSLRSIRGGYPSSQDSPLESRSLRKLEGLSVGNLYSNLHWYAAQKGLKDGKDDSGRFSGVFSSSGSPRFGFSRSSSRLSMQDDLDDGDFSCPFAVDDVDVLDSPTSNVDGKGGLDSMSSRRAQDAAVGVLVHMLKTAAPLRQQLSYSQSSKSGLNTDVGASSFFMSRKTSDALEELQSYREMKDMLLSRSESQLHPPKK